MSEHLSDLQLDEIAAGISEPPDHLAVCDQCRSRLERFEEARRVAIEAPSYRDTLTALEAASAKRPRAFRPLFFGVPALAGAAAIALFLAFRPLQGSLPADRIKGTPGLELRRVNGESGQVFEPGDRVVLVARGAGLENLLVLAWDDTEVVELWPTEGEVSGTLSGEAVVRLDPPFEVTPGDLELCGVFSQNPITGARASELLSATSGDSSPVIRLETGEVLVRLQLRVRAGGPN